MAGNRRFSGEDVRKSAGNPARDREAGSRRSRNGPGRPRWSVQFSVLLVSCVFLAAPLIAVAEEPLTSDNYRLEPNASNSFGGLSDNDQYSLLGSGGEAAVGLGDSPSYKLSSGYVEQLEQAIQLNVLPAGLDGYWPMNTGAGIQAYDETASNNRGVLVNSPAWVDGRVGGGALDFNGSNKTNQGDSNDQTDSFTLSAWINPDDVSTSGQRIIYKDDGTTGWALSLGDPGSGRLRFYTRETSPRLTDTGDVISANNWYHVVAVFDNSADTKSIYVNGTEEARTTGVSGSQSGNGDDLEFGRNFDGTIDEVRIYPKALTQHQIRDQYNASDANIPSALTVPEISPDASQTVRANAVVRTDAGGYDLAIEQTQDLTRVNGSETIPAISPGTISNPEPWNEGSTTGFGFTVTDAVQRDSKWGTDPDYEYAAIPGTKTTFHSRSGLSGAFKETATMEFRLGVDYEHTAGVYTNKLGFTATLKP